MIFGEDAGRSAFFAEIGSKVEALNTIPSEYANLACIGRSIQLVDTVGRSYCIDLFASPGGQLAVRLPMPLSGRCPADKELRHLHRVASIIHSWSAEQLDEVCADSFYQTEGQAADIIDIFVRTGLATYQDRPEVARRLGDTLAGGEILFAVCDSTEGWHPVPCRDLLCEFAYAKGIDPDELTGFIGALEVLDGVSAVAVGNNVLVQYAPPGNDCPYLLMRFSVGKHRSDVIIEPRLTQHQLQRNGRATSDADQFFEALIPYADTTQLSPSPDGAVSLLPLDAGKLVDDPLRLIAALRDFAQKVSA